MGQSAAIHMPVASKRKIKRLAQGVIKVCACLCEIAGQAQTGERCEPKAYLQYEQGGGGEDSQVRRGTGRTRRS